MKTKIVNFDLSLYSPYLIFFLSISASLFVLLLERLFGIGWDFHPDARTYIELSSGSLSLLRLDNIMLGSWFYILVDFFNSNIDALIAFNVLIYSITNVGIANFFYKHTGRDQKQITLLLFLLVIFNPYRLHLSVQVLKDTIIIFGMVYFLISKRFSWLYFIISFLFSLRSAMYLIAVIKRRNFIVVLLLISSFLYWYMGIDGILSILSAEDQVNMTFRQFDSVPNFFEFGYVGAILRAIIWPFFYLTGVFIFFSPSIMYLPIAMGSFFLQVWHLKQYRRHAFYFQIYVAMGVMAFMVSGFTSYIRYTLPLVTILPILIIKRDILNYEKPEKS